MKHLRGIDELTLQSEPQQQEAQAHRRRECNGGPSRQSLLMLRTKSARDRTCPADVGVCTPPLKAAPVEVARQGVKGRVQPE